jgi:hypothetical protein
MPILDERGSALDRHALLPIHDRRLRFLGDSRRAHPRKTSNGKRSASVLGARRAGDRRSSPCPDRARGLEWADRLQLSLICFLHSQQKQDHLVDHFLDSQVALLGQDHLVDHFLDNQVALLRAAARARGARSWNVSLGARRRGPDQSEHASSV